MANLLPPLLNHERGRLRRSDVKFISAMLLLLGVLVAATTDLRGAAAAPAMSADPASSQALGAPLSARLEVYRAHWGWIAAFALLQSALCLRALPWIWALPRAVAGGPRPVPGIDQRMAAPICIVRHEASPCSC